MTKKGRRVKRQRPGQELVEQYAERVDICAGVDVLGGHLRLLGAHVLRCPDQLALLGVDRFLRQALADRLGHAEVDLLRDGLAVLEQDQHVGGLDVTVDDALLVGVLDGFADLCEELQPLLDVQALSIAVLGDGDTRHVLHDEIGPSRLG